ncbi:MAG: hypothetical protein JWP09_737 [Candidatus Taylorbacteria bacterium]|nr:hypothetical protein [Candidatus Taylorbacteria bacterium]
MKTIIVSIVVAVVIIGGAFMLSKGGSKDALANNVSVIDGKQIIEISAKGGYHPLKSTAKAGMPTVLRFDTNGTFDCSSSVRIPSMDISQTLPQTGTTDIDLGTPSVASIQGTCGMGMYRFQVDFQN